MSGELDDMARRVRDDPFFLAAPLERYARSEHLDDAALAARLGGDAGALTRLRLCRNPDAESPAFWRDVERIAGHCGVDGDALAEAVRHGQALLAVQGVAGEAGFLMAARDEEVGE
jgi:hypothetical protein